MSSTTNEECSFDAECPSTQVCMFNTSWWDEKSSQITIQEDALEGCLCSPYYGWIYNPDENECEIGDVMHTFWIATCSVLIIGNVVLASFLLWDVVMLKMYGLLRGDAASTTSVFQLIACVLQIALQTSIIQSSNAPTGPSPLATSSIESDKLGASGEAERVLIAFGVVFTTLSAMCISLLWIEIAWRTTNMKSQGISNLKHYRSTVIAFQVLFFIVMMVTGPGLSNWGLSIFVAFPFLLFITVTYLIGWQRMTKALNSISSSAGGGSELRVKSKYRSIVMKIRRTTITIVFGLAVVLIFGAWFGTLQLSPGGWREVTPPNEISSSAATGHMIWFGTLIVHIAVVYYIHGSIRTRISKVRLGISNSATGTRTMSSQEHANGTSRSPFSKAKSDIAGPEPSTLKLADRLSVKTRGIIPSARIQAFEEDALFISPRDLANMRSSKLKRFIEFCKKSYADEGPRFLLAANEFIDSFTAGNKDQEKEAISEKANEIFEEFIKVGSPSEITLEYKTREKIDKAIRSKDYNAKMFDRARFDVAESLLQSLYPEFADQEQTES